MKVKRAIAASSLAAGVGLAGLFGVGLATASADPGQPCGGPNAAACQPGPGQGGEQRNGGPAQQPVEQRGIDQGRQDHQPFMYNGQRVEPMFDHDRNSWGFWFFGLWIPL
jgi:hypothetical protein